MSDQDYDYSIAPGIFVLNSIRQTFRLQNTIGRAVSIDGFGFWTGEDVSVEFRPAEPDSGLVFVRADLPGMPRIPARVEFREEKPRQTSLVCGQARVDMVEHLLAALRGLKIDNCEIVVDKPEMPGLDGSSKLFVEVLEQAGMATQPAVRKIRLVTRAFSLGNDEQRIRVSPGRNGCNSYRFTLVPTEDYPISRQDFQCDLSRRAFRRDIMACRTFLAKYEADYLQDMGLCARVTPRDVLVLTDEGPLNNEFRCENECARHKVLDMIGDFALVDCDWVGHFESYRGGHSLNAECVKHLLEHTTLLDESYLSRQSELFHYKKELLERAA